MTFSTVTVTVIIYSACVLRLNWTCNYKLNFAFSLVQPRYECGGEHIMSNFFPHSKLGIHLLQLIAVFSCLSVSRSSMANGQNIVIVTLTQWWLAAQPAAEGHSTSRKSTDGLWRWSGKVKCHYYRFPLSERNHLGINAECGGAFKSSYSRRVKTLMAAAEDGSEKTRPIYSL